jgi:transposase
MGDVRNNLAFKKSVQVLLLAQSEKSQRTIAYRFDSNQSIVSKLLRRRRETGRHIRRPGQSRKRITTPHQDQYLRLISIREGFLTALLFFKIACHVRQYALRLSEKYGWKTTKGGSDTSEKTSYWTQVNCSPSEELLKLCIRTCQLGRTRLGQSFGLR